MTLDKAIRHCEEVADRCAVTDGGLKCEMEHRQLAEWLKELKLRRTEHRWIPCSERLPEKCGVYLVSGGSRVWLCELVQIMTVYGWANDARNPVVTAWMPLPEPYKGD